MGVGHLTITRNYRQFIIYIGCEFENDILLVAHTWARDVKMWSDFEGVEASVSPRGGGGVTISHIGMCRLKGYHFEHF